MRIPISFSVFVSGNQYKGVANIASNKQLVISNVICAHEMSRVCFNQCDVAEADTFNCCMKRTQSNLLHIFQPAHFLLLCNVVIYLIIN